ncbi:MULTISPECIES: dihydrofolate reductase family protein [Niastella]|uniref:Dihydrofolate reductase family protein n=1 Tax=Niastella soli TaxID=2821487 RepID=A0ABS3Z0N5_9BACT|nr:dihydrofolate reductase family protein [Niastella soli]MBO9203731.1 dihydrofolate reductase family protein [Niastella soli]
MRRLVLFMHVSLDGFVTDPNGGMGFIKVDEEIFDYVGDRTNLADMALYGRVTYEMMDAYWPTAPDKPNATKHEKEHGAWYNKVDKVVLSKTMKGQQRPNTIIISEDVEHRIKSLKQQAGSEILIFGSPSAAHSLMQYGLIDEFWLFVNPVLVGGGTPLFNNTQLPAELKLVKSKSFSNGVVCLGYEKA